ncbi:hypothetical protein VTN31DRAFT_3013 [Thermomyces dupontii]|uniref:uncharacterized protein n=1 Tax=Talaromyces thermophilus TaxID=28565 RepID=UPI0037437374
MKYRRQINKEKLRLRQAEKELEEATEQASATPEALQSAADGANQNNRKRRRLSDASANSGDDAEGGTHPLPFLTSGYDGGDLVALNRFLENLDSHFEAHPTYYRTESRKIGDAVSWLSPKMNALWNEYVSSCKDRRQTWKEFGEFFRQQETSEEQQKRAARTMFAVRQRPGQTVDKFAEYLERAESHFPAMPAIQRKEFLRSRILDPIRQESFRRDREEPENYRDFVQFLARIEKDMNERRGQQAPASPSYKKKR